jgi:hypothetical protein
MYKRKKKHILKKKDKKNMLFENVETLHSLHSFEKTDQVGSGVLDVARKVAEKSKQAASKLTRAYTSELATTARNMLPGADANARDGFAGELHAVLQLPNGKSGVANFLGPGTQVIKRLRRGDPPRTFVDNIAKMHDVEYALSQGARSVDEQVALLRKADTRMLKNLERAQREHLDTDRNILLAKRPLQLKVLAEESGVLKKNQFGGPLRELTKSDEILLRSEEKALAQQGFGHGCCNECAMPGDRLKKKMIKNWKQKQKQKGRGLSLAGAGVGLEILQIVKTILREIGIPIPPSLKQLIEKGIQKGVKIPQLILDVVTLSLRHSLHYKGNITAQHLLPFLKKYIRTYQTGSGLKLAGMGKGRGAKHLRDFIKGFKKVAKPFLQTLAPALAVATGNPELAPVAVAASQML